MKWDIGRSNEVKQEILENEKLMQRLSETVADILKEFGINLEGMSYIFEPRVFRVDEDEMPEIQIKSHKAKINALINYWKYGNIVEIFEEEKFPKPTPVAGPLDPIRLSMIEKYRIHKESSVMDDPVPIIRTSDSLIQSIVGNKELLTTLSESIFNLLEENKIMFNKDEGCLFVPALFETPIYAQVVSEVKEFEQVRGFGPAVLADPTPEPAQPGIIRIGDDLTVGLAIKDILWVGIPAPEMMRALDILRKIQ